MTGNEIISYVRRKVGEPVASFWQNSDMQLKINEASKQVARDTRVVTGDFYLNTSEGTATYNFSSETEFLSESEEGVWISDGTDWKELDVHTFDYLNEEYPDWKNASNDQPRICVIERKVKNITLYPPPSSTYAGDDYLHIYTEELTADIANFDTELELPRDLHYAVAFWAIKDCKEDRGLYNQAAYWKKMYDEKTGQGATDTQHTPARKIRVRSYKDRYKDRVRTR
jgi:hypothetical protein